MILNLIHEGETETYKVILAPGSLGQDNLNGYKLLSKTWFAAETKAGILLSNVLPQKGIVIFENREDDRNQTQRQEFLAMVVEGICSSSNAEMIASVFTLGWNRNNARQIETDILAKQVAAAICLGKEYAQDIELNPEPGKKYLVLGTLYSKISGVLKAIYKDEPMPPIKGTDASLVAEAAAVSFLRSGVGYHTLIKNMIFGEVMTLAYMAGTELSQSVFSNDEPEEIPLIRAEDTTSGNLDTKEIPIFKGKNIDQDPDRFIRDTGKFVALTPEIIEEYSSSINSKDVHTHPTGKWAALTPDVLDRLKNADDMDLAISEIEQAVGVRLEERPRPEIVTPPRRQEVETVQVVPIAVPSSESNDGSLIFERPTEEEETSVSNSSNENTSTTEDLSFSDLFGENGELFDEEPVEESSSEPDPVSVIYWEDDEDINSSLDEDPDEPLSVDNDEHLISDNLMSPICENDPENDRTLSLLGEVIGNDLLDLELIELVPEEEIDEPEEIDEVAYAAWLDEMSFHQSRNLAFWLHSLHQEWPAKMAKKHGMCFVAWLSVYHYVWTIWQPISPAARSNFLSMVQRHRPPPSVDDALMATSRPQVKSY